MSNIEGYEMLRIDVSLQQKKGNAKQTNQQLGLAQVAIAVLEYENVLRIEVVSNFRKNMTFFYIKKIQCLD